MFKMIFITAIILAFATSAIAQPSIDDRIETEKVLKSAAKKTGDGCFVGYSKGLPVLVIPDNANYPSCADCTPRELKARDKYLDELGGSARLVTSAISKHVKSDFGVAVRRGELSEVECGYTYFLDEISCHDFSGRF